MEIINNILDILSKPIFSFNNNSFTLAKILILVLSFVVLFYVSNKIKSLLAKRLLKRRNFSEASKQTIAILSRYFVLVLGLIIILNQIGIDLNSLAVIFGALGVGIGFGLQNVINNFVSGIIILFERPVQVGDRIEVADVEGNVLEINLRSTTVRTNDNVNIIVPNSEFISKNVVNWSHNDKKVRRRIEVGVSYQEDPEKIKNLLLEVAKGHDEVLDSPEPDVLFKGFGESSLDFELRVWTEALASKPGLLTSNINFSIAKIFEKNDIKVPYPQRDLYIKEKP